MVSSEGGDSSSNGGGELMRRKVLGLGYWVQGFRCFPWLAVSFFLKDGLNVDPSTLQLLQNSANLPMVGKPLYGLVSDSIYISGQHRVPYIALGGNKLTCTCTLPTYIPRVLNCGIAIVAATSWFLAFLKPYRGCNSSTTFVRNIKYRDMTATVI